MFRMETLDSWDQVLNIAFYGCKHYPNGYPLLNNIEYKSDDCHDNYSAGFMGGVVLLIFMLLGAYILPTVLIGIVSIEFFVARKRMQEYDIIEVEMETSDARSMRENPMFFTKDRCRLLRALFIRLDADGEMKLDMQEITPFFHYVFDKCFGVDLDRQQVEALFHLMDVDFDVYVGYEEFISFFSTIKRMEYLHQQDPTFSQKTFPINQVRRSMIDMELDPWKRCMSRMDDYAIEEAWSVMVSLKGNQLEEEDDDDEDEEDKEEEEGDGKKGGMRKKKKKNETFALKRKNKLIGKNHKIDNDKDNEDDNSLKSKIKNPLDLLIGTDDDHADDHTNTLQRVKELFKTFDNDDDALIDVDELTEGLIKLRILMNKRQIMKLTKQMDLDGDGYISFNEFETQLEIQKNNLLEKEKLA
eukprot:CAMPEP_0114328932 /NCGR_PEP_ID=MMETSP0101-20121206/736_1 /TAXON_ID=38822 ORGANISM="Pteridomonas danica, Strain PT" /NCGR_SAMPLE_ID=MMETSP0101 /ASSEMBLY_ACC=CAM_ASM_000211 /LENGTH=413 /DNA_ID=CAMNT_0001458419 /DNA_START=2049 /DNA_END=3287 /DNA_ORIENTATION=+